MIPLRQNLRLAIETMVNERQVFHEHALCEDDYQFLVETMTSLCYESIDKFIQGGKEHNPNHERPFVLDCDHLRELDKEVIDFIMYSRAHRYRQTLHK